MVGATDTFNIHDVRLSETSIPMQDAPLKTYIDDRNIDEAPSGGYVSNGEYILPHDLGLGKHRMEILTSKGTTTYDFYVVKADENVSIYDDYTPYYYDEDATDETIEEDYNAFNDLYLFGEDTGAIEEEDEINIDEIVVSIDPTMYYFDERLTTGETII